MKSIYKFYLILFFLLSDFVVFAQPNDEDTGGGLEGGDPQPAPINSKLMLLAIAGVCYAVYTFRKNRKTA